MHPGASHAHTVSGGSARRNTVTATTAHHCGGCTISTMTMVEGGTTTWVAIKRGDQGVGGVVFMPGCGGGCICAVEKLEGTCGASLGWSRAEGQNEKERKRKEKKAEFTVPLLWRAAWCW